MPSARVQGYIDAYRWQCGRCETWNEVSDGLCKQCQSPLQIVARAFRLKNELTADEVTFFRSQIPRMVALLEAVERHLFTMEDSLSRMRVLLESIEYSELRRAKE